MQVHTMEQYSDEYWKAKLGKVSASGAVKIVSPTGKASASCKDYLFKKLAELETGEREETALTYAMKRGLALEPEARKRFAFMTGLEVAEVGLVTNKKYDYMCCSPDGLDPKYRKFGVEIKCPMPGEQLRTRFENEIPTKYKPQVFFSLWLCTSIEKWYYFSYHPDMEPVLLSVDRENESYKKYISALVKSLCGVEKVIGQVKALL